MATCLPRAYEKALAMRRELEISLADAEQRTLGTDHAAIGGKLVEHWGLPEVLSLPILWHQEPERLPEASSEVATVTNILNVADVVARMFCEPNGERLVDQVRDRAEARLHLSTEAMDDLLQHVGSEVRQTADMFEMDLGGYADYADILGKANVSLGQLAEASATPGGRPKENYVSEPGRLATILSAEVGRAAGFSRPLGVVLLAVDDARRLQQTFGENGFAGLAEPLAALTVSTVRATDTVVRGAEPGRLFILLPGCRDEALKGTAERMRQTIGESQFSHEGESVSLTVCVAALCYCNFERTPSAEQLLKAAEKVLEQARKRGPNTALFARV
jgi:diguanylate cyclase (GGDEF)-like protein